MEWIDKKKGDFITAADINGIGNAMVEADGYISACQERLSDTVDKEEFEEFPAKVEAATQQQTKNAEDIKPLNRTAADIADKQNRLENTLVNVGASENDLRTQVEKQQNTVSILWDKVFRDTPRTWADVQAIVRAGLARDYFSIGDQFDISATDTPMMMDIIGFDHDTPVDKNYTHSMTLQLHGVTDERFQFAWIEWGWYKVNGDPLPAGTYNFTLPAGYDTRLGGGKTYNFTVPDGSDLKATRLIWPWDAQVKDSKMLVLKSDSTSIELSISEGAAGTALPTMTRTTVQNDDWRTTAEWAVNSVERMRYGSGRWKDSLIRSRLEWEDERGAWICPCYEASPISPLKSFAGTKPEWEFFDNISKDFLNVIGRTRKATQKSVTDGYGLEVTEDRFFLLSRAEVYGGIERAEDGADGTPYEYYSARSSLSSSGTAGDTNRIKYDSGNNACEWLLRTAAHYTGDGRRSVYPSGGIDERIAVSFTSISPACVIY